MFIRQVSRYFQSKHAVMLLIGITVNNVLHSKTTSRGTEGSNEGLLSARETAGVEMVGGMKVGPFVPSRRGGVV